MSKTHVIGDIHGGLKALEQLIERATIQEDDTLIFLGDYVDGWSESAQTISYLIELNRKHNCIFIKGNHDVYCENWLLGKDVNPNWLLHGGVMTKQSYATIDQATQQKHLDFFARMKFYHVDDENRLFIHAGFTSMKGPEQEFHQSNYTWDRTLWEMALTMDKRIAKNSLVFPKRLLLYKEIFIGHTPTLNYDVETPMQGCNVWNIDTGAAFKGRLSMLDIETKIYIQSDPVHTLYPTEKGRN